ncbi:MAG TPA: mechanosensitive ion channel family protein [Steroidobacteraceae bacterium]|nr:mechanosensitive ion channel family protein [Steroidobacteraceae bacterium]
MTCQRDIASIAAWACLCMAFGQTSAQTPGGPGHAAPTRSGSVASAHSSAPAPASGTAQAPPISGNAVLGLVKQTIDWYHETQDVGRLPELAQDVVAHDRLQQAALSVVRQAFAFGHAAASLLTSSSGTAAGSHPATALEQAVARINARIASLQSQLTQIGAQRERSIGRARTALQAQYNDVSAALALEREVQSTIQNLQRFQTSTLMSQGHGTQDLLGQIEDLERSVPEARTSAGASASPAASGGTKSTSSASSGSSFRPESTGVLSLIGDWFSLESAAHQLNSMSSATDALRKELAALRAPLIAEARGLVAADTTSLDTQNTAQLQAARLALEDAANRFKELAALLVPLGEQNFVLDDAQGAVREWHSSLDSQLGAVERNLLMRIGLLAVLIALILIVSEVWRRATFRYFQDARRRSQFQTLRRVAVGIALVFVVTFGLVSQLGSLATYVGFLTAGLAVALQNVILSVVAYFFLIGRYGVRVGDRITLAGVTGRVLDIGLVRLYLMELGGTDLHSTGRVVVMSNSVLFQPQALFKQVPGADFLWHTVSITLATTVDLQEVQQRLQATADAVYEHYRDVIEAQHAAVQRLGDFETAMPRPEVRVGYAEQGLQFEVRYPVQGARAARIDQQMLKAVREMLAKEPKLPVVSSGEPTLKRLEG